MNNNLASLNSVFLAMEQSTVTVSFHICVLLLERIFVSSQIYRTWSDAIYSQFLK